MAAGEGANIAKRAVVKYVMDHVIRARTDIKSFGLGSGTTIEMAMKDKDIGLGEYLRVNKVKIIPTSFQAHEMVVAAGLADQLTNVKDTPVIDFAIDGADEVDENLILIKGGGACFLGEKIVAHCAKELIIIGDHTKRVKSLGEKWKNGVPIEVQVNRERVLVGDYSHPGASVKAAVLKAFGGDETKTTFRQSTKKCGPVITDAGNLVLDWIFPTDVKFDWKAVDEAIRKIPGVVETGLFVNMAKVAYFGQEDGTVTTLGKQD
ncbi:putative Ribose-5-phosphate isomerase [Hypsibius exemplaris]|uniref:ribose-5-phosphate isomerase n=1 Tax=Hypsibius exemplaris TaxID=2072580 RepID=A0A1W0W9N6_HYPEX|nr:putative Ribose-5-phosphate isomerase [Hypsibius exemplaris]